MYHVKKKMVTYIQNFTKKKKRHQFFLKWGMYCSMGIFWSSTIRTRNKLKMKSLDPPVPAHPPARPLQAWAAPVLKALMLRCCSANSPVVPFPPTKSVKSSTQTESLQLEFMLSCPFFSTKRCTFLLWNRLKTSFFTCSYRKDIGRRMQ